MNKQARRTALPPSPTPLGSVGAVIRRCAGCAAILSLIVVTEPAWSWEGQELLDAGRATVEDFKDATKHPAFGDTLGRAKAIVIVPQVNIISFMIFEFAETNALLLMRSRSTGDWGNPAFMKISVQEFRFQPHADMLAVAFVVMTDAGAERFLSGKARLGPHLNIVDGDRLEASANDSGADIIEFVHGGYEKILLPLSNSTISFDATANEAYYDRPPVLQDIVFGESADGADALRAELNAD